MNLKKLVAELDKMVEKGHIIEAFEKYFHDDVITHSDAGDSSNGKAQKREFLHGFFGNIKKIDEIKLHKSHVGEDVTFSKFTFKFVNFQDEKLHWHEIIRRKWLDGSVVDEYYFTQKWDDLMEEVAPSKPKKEKKAEKEKAPKAEKNVKAAKAAPKKEAKATATKEKDDLKKVEGIGPKIESLLNAAGIVTYVDLAKANPEHIKEILLAAGSRYRIHDPATWPKQSDLLAKGDLEALQVLQDELKGGKVVE